ncbi:MAG: Gfo/Idh/MocA family protein [Fimbriiglobus sp.]
MNRRGFLLASAGVVSGLPFVRGSAWRADKLRLGVIGVADRGAANLAGVAHEDIVGLCEIDEPRATAARKQFPEAKFFTDYRQMFDKIGKELDAVVVSTPDHTHAHPAILAMRMGKPVYCEKPLARSVGEVRLMQKVAAEKKIITQMGTQIHSGDNYRRVVEIVQSGLLGPVKTVHVWLGNSPPGLKKVRAPKQDLTFKLDQWLGPVPEDFFYADSKNWPHFHWRYWWAFGGGQLGDFGCHFMDLPFWALGLGAPSTISAKGTPIMGADNTIPGKMQVDYTFKTPGGTLDFHWYHGVSGPDYTGERKIPGFGSGVLFEGEKGKLVADYGKYKLLPDEFAKDVKLPEQKIAKSIGHYKEWLAAIRGNGKALCDFGYSGTLTEAVLLGNVAYRTGESLTWDSAKGEVTNSKAAMKYVTPEVRKGWEMA